MKSAITICALCIVAGLLLQNAPGYLGELMRTCACLGVAGFVVLPFVALDLKLHEGDTEGIDL